mmetsp:Transcript_9311/g.27349  ORF Transcript_9311/g.27349 Transcript_9311/m.27349 type:complete len:328 (-) Transcript_9311:327-1310(-)
MMFVQSTQAIIGHSPTRTHDHSTSSRSFLLLLGFDITLIRVLALLLALFLLLLVLLLLLAAHAGLAGAEAHLVVEQVVQRDDGADERRDVHDEVQVVGLDHHRAHHVLDVQVRQQVEDGLQVVHDLVVHGHAPRDDVLEVGLHLLEALREALERRDLLLHLVREGGDARVVDVAQQVLHAHLLGLLRPDGGRDVPEGAAHLLAILLHVLLRHVRLGGDAAHARPHVDDDEYRLRAVAPEQLVEPEVVLADERPRAVEALDALLRVNLLEHGVHVLQEVVVQVPHRRVLLVLFERYAIAVRDVHKAPLPRAQQHPHDALVRPPSRLLG